VLLAGYPLSLGLCFSAVAELLGPVVFGPSAVEFLVGVTLSAGAVIGAHESLGRRPIVRLPEMAVGIYVLGVLLILREPKDPVLVAQYGAGTLGALLIRMSPHYAAASAAERLAQLCRIAKFEPPQGAAVRVQRTS